MGLSRQSSMALLFAAISICMMPNLVHSSDLKKVSATSAKCDAGKKNACDELAAIATGDKDAEIRRAAAVKLADQSVLLKIATSDSDAGVRVAAVERLTDQSTLSKFALSDQDAEVRSAAVKNLTDQTALSKIAISDVDSGVCEIALSRVSGQADLANIAMNAEGRFIRRVAMSRLTDKPLRQEIVEKEIKSIHAHMSDEAVTFAPVVTITADSEGWVPVEGWHQSPPRVLTPEAGKRFLIVEIEFEPSREMQLSDADISLAIPGTPDVSRAAVGILGNPRFVHYEYVLDSNGKTVSGETSEPQWEVPKADDSGNIEISKKRTLSWLFLVDQGTVPSQYKISVSGVLFSLGAS